MAEDRRPNAGLPLKRDLWLLYVLSSIIALLLAAASLGGLLARSDFYPTQEFLQTYLPNDVISLFIGLPMLLGSMLLAKRGKLIGLLLWPGALIYSLYNDLIYTLALPLGVAFLLHLVLLMLGLYTLAGLLSSIDAAMVQDRLGGKVRERLAGGILAGLGTLFFLRALSVVGLALFNQTPLPETDIALNAADLMVSPAWVVCGVLLWRRQAFGFVTGLGMLFQASMLFIGLIIFMLMQPILTQAPFSLFDIAVVFAMGFICFIPMGLYVRGVLKKHSQG